MALTCDRLMKFDLMMDYGSKKYMEFWTLINEIRNIDVFIRDTPSFPGSTDKIVRNELISVIGATLSIEGTVLEREEIEESFQKAARGERLRRKEQEAENSRKVYYFLSEVVTESRPKGVEYSEQLIRQIHKLFTEDMNYVSNVPGLYRSNFNVTFG